jgi:hypothetical protein
MRKAGFRTGLRAGFQCGALGAAVGVGIVLTVAVAQAEDPPAPEAVELERLLKLPESFDAGGERLGGGTAADWRSRFREARGAVEKAQEALKAAQEELESLAGESSQYQVAAPGTVTPELSPVSYRLREEIRRQREEVLGEEKRLRSLEIEANLANIPPDWWE